MRLTCLIAVCLLAGCAEPPPSAAPVSTPASVERPRPRAFVVEPWALPVSTGAAQPDLVRAPDGALLLSWIEREPRGHALRLARWQGAFGPVRTVARGDDWFVNWADTPHVMVTADGTLWAQWLRKSAAATYAYDVQLARSADGGATWDAPWTVNTDGTPTEHGFASLWAAGRDAVGIAWLDGRNTGGDAHAGHDGHHGGGGAMTLRSAVFAGDGARRDEHELDASTCDCCQTDVVLSGGAPMLAYRDRTADEIRDVVATRLDGEAWTSPRAVHADGWRTPGCPVNGPAAAAHGREAAVAWYTEGKGEPEVLLARSMDAGATFAAPLRIDAGRAVLGRVALARTADAWWVAWLREEADAQGLHLARVTADARRIAHSTRIATLSGRGRGTGVPQLAAEGDGVRVVWTDVVDGAPRLVGALVR